MSLHALEASTSGPGNGQEATLASESSLRAAPGRGPRRGRILVMDDHRMVRETMRRQLVVFGYEVAVAADGREALAAYEQARRAGAPFDMVVLDRIVDGGWGGEQTFVELRRLDPGARAMLWCGSPDAPSETYLRRGFGAVLGKPYSLTELHSKLDQVLCPGARPPAARSGAGSGGEVG